MQHVSAIANSHHHTITVRNVKVTCTQHEKFGISFVQVIFTISIVVTADGGF